MSAVLTTPFATAMIGFGFGALAACIVFLFVNRGLEDDE